MKKHPFVALMALALIGCSEAPASSSAPSSEPSSSAPSSSSAVSSSSVSSSSSSKASSSSYVPMKEGSFFELAKDFIGVDFDFVTSLDANYRTESVSSTVYMIEENETKAFLNERFAELYLTAYDGDFDFGRPDGKGLIFARVEMEGKRFGIETAFSSTEVHILFKESIDKKIVRSTRYSGPLTGTWAEDVRNTLLEQGNCYCK